VDEESLALRLSASVAVSASLQQFVAAALLPQHPARNLQLLQ
jgi:hypothetical protein